MLHEPCKMQLLKFICRSLIKVLVSCSDYFHLLLFFISFVALCWCLIVLSLYLVFPLSCYPLCYCISCKLPVLIFLTIFFVCSQQIYFLFVVLLLLSCVPCTGQVFMLFIPTVLSVPFQSTKPLWHWLLLGLGIRCSTWSDIL